MVSLYYHVLSNLYNIICTLLMIQNNQKVTVVLTSWRAFIEKVILYSMLIFQLKLILITKAERNNLQSNHG